MMSKNSSRFQRWAVITLIFTYLVITAGSIVRATGSGMGCPDWPKCFGHFIPPTQLEQLEFAEGKSFRKGHFIIWNESLWKAKKHLTAGAEINLDEWEKYTKHDYARFNAMHTWTEYVNRLMGALLGFASLIMLVMAIRARRDDRALPWLSALIVFLIGFEGWLGATVVESNLQPAKITTHMIGALIIVAVLMATIARARRGGYGQNAATLPRYANGLMIFALFATVAQVVLGTQVREQVDELDKIYDGILRYTWVEQLGSVFTVHKLFAYGVILLNGILVYRLWRKYDRWSAVRLWAILVLAGLAVEWGSGVSLALYGIPAYIQPVHLVLATLVFGFQYQLWTVTRSSGRLGSSIGV